MNRCGCRVGSLTIYSPLHRWKETYLWMSTWSRVCGSEGSRNAQNKFPHEKGGIEAAAGALKTAYLHLLLLLFLHPTEECGSDATASCGLVNKRKLHRTIEKGPKMASASLIWAVWWMALDCKESAEDQASFGMTKKHLLTVLHWAEHVEAHKAAVLPHLQKLCSKLSPFHLSGRVNTVSLPFQLVHQRPD